MRRVSRTGRLCSPRGRKLITEKVVVDDTLAGSVGELHYLTVLINGANGATGGKILQRLRQLQNSLGSLAHSIKDFARRTAIRLPSMCATIGIEPSGHNEWVCGPHRQ